MKKCFIYSRFGKLTNQNLIILFEINFLIIFFNNFNKNLIKILIKILIKLIKNNNKYQINNILIK